MATEPQTENVTIELRWNGYHLQIIEDNNEHWLVIARNLYDVETESVATKQIALPASGLDSLILALNKVRDMYRQR